ncbi:MAG: hypothetical protein KBD01_12905 [Acidobacteria bacterium]|nr:hypothetical protein [Acidobacteriota bacterium]
MTFKHDVPAQRRVLRKLSVNVFPSFILMNKDGAEISRWAGFGKAQPFIEELRRRAADARPFDAKLADFDKSPSADVAHDIADSLALLDRPVEALEYYERAIALDAKLQQTLSMSRMYAASSAVDAGLEPYEVLPPIADAVLAWARPQSRQGIWPFVRQRAWARWSIRAVAATLLQAYPEDRADRSPLKPYADEALATYGRRRPKNDWEREQKESFERVLEPRRSLDRRLADFQAKPDAGAGIDLGRELVREERYSDALEVFHRVASVDPGKAADAAEWALLASAHAYRDQAIALDAFKKEVDGFLAAQKDDAGARLTADRWIAMTLVRGQDNAYLEPRLAAALETTEKAEKDDDKELHKDLVIVRALAIEKDAPKAIALKREQLGEGFEEDIAQTTDYAYFLWRSVGDLEQAAAAARAAVKLPGNRYERVSAHIMLASILHAKGETAAALEILHEAQAIRPRDTSVQRLLARWTE